MHLKSYLFSIVKNLYRHKMNYLINVTLLQLVLVMSSTFVLSTLFQIMLKLSGETQLNKENYVHVLFTPVNLVLTLLFILILALFMLIEFSFLTLLTYGYYKQEHYALKTILHRALTTYKQLFGIQLLYFILYFILTLPIAHLSLSSILTQDLYIPKFITGEIVKTPLGFWLYTLTMIVLAFLNYRLILVIPLMILDGRKVSQSMKLSWRLTGQHQFKLITVIITLQTALIIVMTILFSIVVMVFSIIDPQGNHWLATPILFIILKGLFFLGTVITKLILVATLVYYLINHHHLNPSLKVVPPRPYSRTIKCFLVVLLAMASAASIYELRTYSFNDKVEIIAHRGFVKKGVENSFESLKAAGALHVDYVEMDIVMTRDQQFAVIHDNQLKRLTGHEGHVQDMTLAELQQLTLRQGEWTSKIMSLEEAVQQARKQQTQLLIELKPYGQEPANYVDILLEHLERLHVGQHAKLMSLDYDLISKVKTRTHSIPCGYIIPFQIGDLPKTNLDFYLIEDFSYSPELASQAHQMNKKLYVWTVNGEDDIVKYLNTPIDGIITDDPDIVNAQKQTFLFENQYAARAIRALLY
ncbi:glycerophosphoryl diester phosphodiesterase membrane domain-containing protein [Staphylococcus lutrae]|uniref:GP-PDE domain-containing protein n=1 Tax=Staphylococcus lutrae TaxID=155085 RepID=A0AAC9WJF8_9STAP|nr:glycerophosphodiester phosphodiesterase [Staphylococcus lutrae]ARJ50973.1 hypothetical protein B5P37_06390 [Staphylococcus lutrae]PNZ38536.1 hypothetical protein CD134_04165 [Staphylococcus lutrae]